MVVFLVIGLVFIAPPVVAQEAEQSEREAMYSRYLDFGSFVKGGSVDPHWMGDGSSFWYAEGDSANISIWKVDPTANTKTPLFDIVRLRRALVSVLGHELPHHGLPFDTFTFVDEDEQAVKFTVEDKTFVLRLESYVVTPSAGAVEDENNRPSDPPAPRFPGKPSGIEALSPDGHWSATLWEHNIWLRSTTDGRPVQLTRDGVDDNEWSGRYGPRWAWWSPDSSKLAATKVDRREMPSVPIVDWLKPREEVEWHRYSKIGEPLPQTELFVFDLASNRRTRVEDFQGPFQGPVIGWRRDGSEVLFSRQEVEFNISATLDLVAYNTETGATRTVFTETQKTFISPSQPTLLEDGKRLIWTSERNGWYHLYLYDIDEGLIRQLTDGAFPVVGELRCSTSQPLSRPTSVRLTFEPRPS